MKKIILFVFIAIILNACKEEEVSSQQFVQNYIIGKWPVKRAVFKTTVNGVVTVNDTLIYGLDSPAVVLEVDTMQFAADGKCVKKGEVLNYTIDETGDNITYSDPALGKWNITYLRIKNIILTQERSEKKGNDTYIYFKEEQLVK